MINKVGLINGKIMPNIHGKHFFEDTYDFHNFTTDKLSGQRELQ